MQNKESTNHRIYQLVKLIPAGQVSSYGQIAKMVGRCGARQVGYAMAATPKDQNIPWHRIINSQGKISIRKEGAEDSRQMKLLQSEGVVFNANGKVDFTQFGWLGPDWQWLKEHGYHMLEPL